MIKRSIESIAGTWLAGLLVVLPIGLTIVLVVWLADLLIRFFGPGSIVGRMFAAIGAPLAGDSPFAYLLGTLLLIAAIYPIGLAVQAGLKRPLKILADRVVGLLDRSQSADLRAMSPVWCFFGGDGVAVLALAPSAEPITIEGRAYRAVLVPTAPVPVGGGLLYVPVEWVKPAQVGMDRVISTYVSMGMTPPTSADSRPTKA